VAGTISQSSAVGCGAVRRGNCFARHCAVLSAHAVARIFEATPSPITDMDPAPHGGLPGAVITNPDGFPGNVPV